LPAGVRARAGSSRVEFVDATDTVVASFGGGIAVDSAKSPATTGVASALVGQAGDVATIHVSVEAEWFGAPDRAFPVTIDPWVTTTLGAADTFVASNAPNSNLDGVGLFKVGKDASNSNELDRGYLQFMGLPSWNANIAVLSADVKAYNFYGLSSAAKTVTVRGSTFGTAAR
jgi:hypothetical protein